MVEQPDFSDYRLRFTAVVPLDRRWVEPDERAFVRFDVVLLRADPHTGELAPIGTAVVFRVREDAGDLWDAADAEPTSALLEEVCARALDDDGGLIPEIGWALGEIGTLPILVLDHISFRRPGDDVPVLRGLLARGVMEHLGTVGAVMFLPAADEALWIQAVGATTGAGFVVASCDLVLPAFPIGVVPVSEPYAR